MNKRRVAILTIAANLSCIWVLSPSGYSWGQQASPRPNPPGMPPHLAQKAFGYHPLKNRLLMQQAQAAKPAKPAPGAKRCSRDCDELLAEARKKGTVRISITLDAPDLPKAARPEAPKDERSRSLETLKEAVARVQDAFLKKLAGRKIGRVYKSHFTAHISMDVDAATLEMILSLPEARSIGEYRGVGEFFLFDSGPKVGAPQAWNAGFTGSGYTIVIIDTGVDGNHPFLRNGSLSTVVAEACFSGGPVGGAPSSTSLCPNGANEQIGPGAAVPCALPGCEHGTHVAGVASGNGGVTFSGVAKEANIIAVQVGSVLPGSGLTWSRSDLEKALNYVLGLTVSYDIAAVNFSGGVGLFNDVCDADPDWGETATKIASLRAQNIATVVASGNGNTFSQLPAPACLSNAVSVGATTKSDAVASYSGNASFLSLLAPGGDESLQGSVCNSSSSGGGICSSVPGGGFKFSSGTSMAAPHVAGAFAVLKQQSPTANVTDLLSVLKSSGVPITDNRPGAPNPPITKPRIQLANTPWTARYSQGGNGSSSAIATDISGNAYVTGTAGVPGTYAVVKYDSVGQQLWAATYGGGTPYGEAYAVTVDQSGNVYVTGRLCFDLSWSCDYSVADTVKYDPNGVQLWTARVEIGSVNSGQGIAVDGSGNVYVVGYSCTGSPCAVTDSVVFVTTKYDSNGNQSWSRTYTYAGSDGPGAIALDASGNVYVTGWSCSTMIEGGCVGPGVTVTIKYTANGSQVWAVRDTNLGYGAAIAVDTSGNVHITGSNPPATAKYDSNGNSLWVVPGPDGQGGFALALDAIGNVYVAGQATNQISTDTEYFAAKYNSNGSQQWLVFHASGFSSDWDTMATGIGLDGAGNSYVSGIACAGTDGSYCNSWGYVTLKYGPNGTKLWNALQEGLGGANYYPALSVRSGSAYVTGPNCTADSCGSTDILTVKYTPN